MLGVGDLLSNARLSEDDSMSQLESLKPGGEGGSVHRALAREDAEDPDCASPDLQRPVIVTGS